jgi:hypothetical protein
MRVAFGITTAVVALASAADGQRVRSAQEVIADPKSASVIDVNLATIDLAAAGARTAASMGLHSEMRGALVVLRDASNHMIAVLDDRAPAKTP